MRYGRLRDGYGDNEKERLEREIGRTGGKDPRSLRDKIRA